MTTRIQRHEQRGVVLFVSLVLLLLLTIIGVSAVQTTSLEERMARNSHDSVLAFQSAEVALREAEDWLADNVINPQAQFDDTNGLWQAAEFDEDVVWGVEANWTGSGSVPAATVVPGVHEQPRYMIEWVATVERTQNPYLLGTANPQLNDRIEIFRITARGVGGSANARVMLQSTFGMVF